MCDLERFSKIQSHIHVCYCVCPRMCVRVFVLACVCICVYVPICVMNLSKLRVVEFTGDKEELTTATGTCSCMTWTTKDL